MNSKFFVALAFFTVTSPVYAQTYNFSNFNSPGASRTLPNGINDKGEIVGIIADVGNPTLAFLYSGGVFTTLKLPYEGGMPQSINNRGQIVGYGGSVHAFLYDHGSVTPIDHPLATNGTAVTGINDVGQMVGWYTVDNVTHGFLYSGGVFTPIDYPGSLVQITAPSGINNKGQVVGHYNLQVISNGAHGFIYEKGNYTTLDHPLTTNGSTANGINDKGQIAGHYVDGNVIQGFVVHGYLYSGGNFTTLDDPLGTLTDAISINNVGAIVGNYNPSGQPPIGFLATPCVAQGKSLLELDDEGQPTFSQMGVRCTN